MPPSNQSMSCIVLQIDPKSMSCTVAQIDPKSMSCTVFQIDPKSMFCIVYQRRRHGPGRRPWPELQPLGPTLEHAARVPSRPAACWRALARTRNEESRFVDSKRAVFDSSRFRFEESRFRVPDSRGNVCAAC